MTNVAGADQGFVTRVFRWLGEALRDKKRDELCAGLCAIDVEARMAVRGRPEEETGPGSLGLIGIADSLIPWINVRRVGSGENLVYITEYGVPDPRYLPQLEIRSVRVKTFPILGRVIDVRWEAREGNDLGLGIVDRLGYDPAIKDVIMGTGDEVTVVARRDYGCWLIRCRTAATPSPEQWGCYQTIAERLLATPLERIAT